MNVLELHNEDDNDDGDENNSNSNSMYVVGSSSIIKGFYFFNSIYFVGPICVCVCVCCHQMWNRKRPFVFHNNIYATLVLLNVSNARKIRDVRNKSANRKWNSAQLILANDWMQKGQNRIDLLKI